MMIGNESHLLSQTKPEDYVYLELRIKLDFDF
jgi:hypothetical protein